MLRFVIGALALVTPASAVLFEHDLFRATCAGGVYWMPGSNVEVGMDMSSGLDQQEAFYAGVYQEAKQACPALADEEFQRRFVPGLHSVVNMLDKNSKLTSTCPGVFARGFATDAPWTLMDKTMVGVKSPVAQLMMGISPLHALSQAYNVGASDEVNKFDLQSTCTYQSLLDNGHCSFEIDLTSKFAMKLQVAATLCPNSKVRHAASVTCVGEGCGKMITSCSTNADCGSTMQCTSPFAGADFTDEQVNSVFRAVQMLGVKKNDRRRLGEQLSRVLFSDADALGDALRDPARAFQRLLSRAQARPGTLDMVQDRLHAARRWLAGATQGLWEQPRGLSGRALAENVDKYNAGNAQLAKLVQMVANFLEFDVPASVSSSLSNLKICGPKDGWKNLDQGWPQCNSVDTPYSAPVPGTVGNFAAQEACLKKCKSVRLVGDGVCDDDCNNDECYNDGGDCNNWVQGFGPPAPRVSRGTWLGTASFTEKTKYNALSNSDDPNRAQAWRETECNGLLSPWDAQLPSGKSAVSAARNSGDDLSPVTVVMPRVRDGVSMAFTACDGSFGFSSGAKRTTEGGRIPKMQAFFAAIGNYVTQFQEARFIANGLVNGPTTEQLRQLFMPWTPFYVLNMTGAAGVPVEAPVTPQGVALAFPMPLQDFTDGKRFQFPPGATCSARDYALGKGCNLEYTKLGAVGFSQPNGGALDLAMSWRQCFNGPTAMPVFGFAMTGSVIESMMPLRECDATSSGGQTGSLPGLGGLGRRLGSRRLAGSCPSNMFCLDVGAMVRPALQNGVVRGVPVNSDPMGNVLFGASNYQLGPKASQTAVSSQYKMMNVINKFVLSLDGGSSSTTSGTLSYCLPTPQPDSTLTMSADAFITQNGNSVSIVGLEANRVNVLGGCTSATGSCPRRIPSYTMRQRLSLAGVSAATFTPRMQRAIVKAYSLKLKVPINQVTIVMITAGSDARRLADDVTFDVVVNAADPTQKSAVESTMSGSAWKTDLQSAITVEFQQSSIATTVTVSSVAPPEVTELNPPGEAESSGLGAGAIAGAVIGSLFAVALVGLAVVKRDRIRELAAARHVKMAASASPVVNSGHKTASGKTGNPVFEAEGKPGAL